MKRVLILTLFIATIAAGIAILYFAPQQTDTNASVSLQEQLDTINDQPPAVVDEVATVPAETTTVPETVTIEPHTNVTSQPPVPTTPSVPVVTNTFTDGTYTSTRSYRAPEGGNEQITVTLTVADDAVAALNVTFVADKGESRKYQQRFDGAIDAVVLGKPLEGLSVSRVGGASLTSRAFNEAIDQIETQAQA